MSEAEIFGTFLERTRQGDEFLTLAFSPSSRPLKDRWRNNGLSADFLADYFVTFMPKDFPESRVAELKAAVSYIANELLENAMKFASVEGDKPIALTLEMDNDHLVFTLKNGVNSSMVERLKAFILLFVSMDPGDYFVMQMERNVENGEESGLGFATMSTDYEARIGWRLDRGEHATLTTQVVVSL